MERVLITGGAGFIGSHITDILADNGYSVVVADNYSNKNSGYKNKNAQYIEVDILNSEFENIFKEFKPEFCIHLAAQASVASAVKNPEYDAMQNIIGSIKVIEFCKKYGVKKIIAASSAAVYGNPKYLPVDENHPTEVLSQYGLSKLTMEKYIKLSGLDYVIFRFANVYGERQTAEGEAGVVAIFNDRMKKNEQIYINGDGEQTRDFVYVKDVAQAVFQSVGKPVKNETINVSTNKAVSINELFRVMSTVYCYELDAIHNEERAGDIKHSILNNEKLTRLIGIKTFCDNKTGLRALHDFNISYSAKEIVK